MLGFFASFGRSRELRHLDGELRAAGVHPALVPEAVKLTMLRLLGPSREAPPRAFADAAALLGFCMLGPEGFADVTDPDLAAATEQRLRGAIDAGDSADARIVLLALHSGLAHPVVVDRFGLESD